MNSLKDLIKDGPVHQRRLEFSTYALTDDRIIVEGLLKDDRFVPRYHLDGNVSPPGKVHRICVRLLMGGWPLSILDAEAQMEVVPHEQCPSTEETVKKVVGLTITHGYGDKVIERIGGVKGCAHMVQLIIAMGNASLHGYWSHRLRKHSPLPGSLKEIPELDYVIGSCLLWNEGGPLIQKIQTALDQQNLKPETE
ncbi:conserved hypothetical protein [uncultured Desulfobacterium sp.]|uniref:DUF2889 domain-containing protein n=1 Tax=uncultured Desulfobacterium sp. TaxID=201089 RepID=A0A445MS75_9BACT|nr:conserved hypothetical protein [uncultured Desulfobacterium sp.]